MLTKEEFLFRIIQVMPEKIFYNIGEVSRMLSLKQHILRYWESEFKMLAPKKNYKGQRVYREQDMEIIKRIKSLIYDEGYTVNGARKKLWREVRRGEGPKDGFVLIKRIKQELKDILKFIDRKDA